MRAIILEKAFNPADFEDAIYAKWREAGAFSPAVDGAHSAPPFTIVIPPPNVTGMLHMGHALNISLQDIVTRFQRMRGRPTLWLPGTDHAGIATQNVVEKRLRARGTSRRELGREKFIEETWRVKAEHHAIITRQIEKMGASVDWNRERFTLDDGLSRAVREVFVTLYERGLIYKGEYLVNWCSSCGTALADDEVEHEDTPGTMYHIRYPVVVNGGQPAAEYIEIATTRPETLLGDTAVAVHPDDPRYQALAGKEVELPLTGRTIPVITDTYVDRAFGTGVVKITPAHDPNDWEVGRRHNLPVINILNPDGSLNENCPAAFRGMSVKKAREAVLEALKAGGYYLKETGITHAVGHCYRCHTVIEPFLSEQWFVKMKPLAEKALAAWRAGEIVFYPRKWENTYAHWLENIRDWCISRQLWWGHRIPAWTCASCGKTTAAREDISVCPHCGGSVTQDEDVLDTWFSSWLWPFSTLGWPEETADMKKFYPTSALVTGYDIIFFWVSRMIMAGLEFTGAVPFRDIYITSLLRDKQGRKMSKSLGNGVDPLELIELYGADALKFTLAFMCAQGQDILMDKESFKLGSKFANKIWNASRYILMNLEGRTRVENPALIPLDKWIYSRLARAAKTMIAAFENYRYNEAAQCVYEYFWNDFCDWYVEATKLSTKNDNEAEKDRAVSVLLDVLSESLKLAHPLLPFVTEEIYSKIDTARMLITARYPSGDDSGIDAALETQFAFLQEIIRSIRTIRSECAVPPEKKIKVDIVISGAENCAFVKENTALITLLANLSEAAIQEQQTASSTNSASAASISAAGAGFEAHIHLAGAIDVNALIAKWKKENEKDKKFIAQTEAKLANKNFIDNAPADLVDAEKIKLTNARQHTEKIDGYIACFTAQQKG